MKNTFKNDFYSILNFVIKLYKYSKKGNTLTKYKILGGVSMRRETRRREDTQNSKNILYIGGSVLGIGIITFAITFVLYGNKMEEQSNINSEKIASLVQKAETNTQAASTQMGKTVEESKNEMESNVANNTTNSVASNTTTKNETATNADKKEETNKTQVENKVNENKKQENTLSKNEKEQEKTVELTFVKPVEGEVSKEYAKENLVYSETLQEWTTHLGIDIKADKTTVVKASADGKIKSIKNDPRYGLSIIIEHQNGYETLYANLLTSEFVQVGENVKQGQSIGTVGDTATFEIADDAHLHFEISKNGENLDPNGYIK